MRRFIVILTGNPRFLRALQWREAARSSKATGTGGGTARRLSLLHKVALLGFVALFGFAIGFASLLTHLVTNEIMENDAAMTARFVTSIADAQRAVAGSGTDRTRFYTELRFMPDVLLAEVIASDRQVVWSSNLSLESASGAGNRIVEQAFASRGKGALFHTSGRSAQDDPPELRSAKLTVDNYIPLSDGTGKVSSVVRLHKEPHGLQRSISRGTQLVWASTAVSALILYLSLLWFIRRTGAWLQEQERRRVEAEALCALGEMSAAVAHGIRNPLASIRTAAELALDADPARARKSATDIMTQVDRLGKWVRDLLEFTRPLAGENRSIDLLSLADECMQTFSAQMCSRGIECEYVRPAADLPPVIGNGALAGQALASIVSNAIEAMPEGGTLRVEFESTLMPQSVKLLITDSGVGMQPGDIDLVFKPYYTTKRDGLGLGMALAQRIMERFGGEISLRSRPGEGSQVILVFRASGIWPTQS
jgi:two-component system sensor histidine kinase HydH